MWQKRIKNNDSFDWYFIWFEDEAIYRCIRWINYPRETWRHLAYGYNNTSGNSSLHTMFQSQGCKIKMCGSCETILLPPSFSQNLSQNVNTHLTWKRDKNRTENLFIADVKWLCLRFALLLWYYDTFELSLHMSRYGKWLLTWPLAVSHPL